MSFFIKINGKKHDVMDLTWHDLAEADYAGIDTMKNMIDQLWSLRDMLVEKIYEDFHSDSYTYDVINHVSHELLQI